MNTHVFIVNKQTLKLHLEYMFAGTGAGDDKTLFLLNSEKKFAPKKEIKLVGMIADISRVRIGDNIIFYLTADTQKILQELFLEYLGLRQRLFLTRMMKQTI